MSPHVSSAHGSRRIATLWQVVWNDLQLSCAVYRHGERLTLSVESEEGVIVSEPFDMQPRAFARAHALRDALVRRGWTEQG
jgi:hypothetical protein